VIKEEAFEASAVVNWLLSNFDSNQYCLTNMKVNKIIYFLHGVVLAREGIPLIRNHFECWDHGPVISSLYHRLKDWADRPVDRLLVYFDYSSSQTKVVDCLEVEKFASNSMRRAAEYFVEKDVWWLVNESHEQGGPWDLAKQDLPDTWRSKRIGDLLIKEHFVNKYGGKATH
jgi:uncharacterized phage-associated protein